MILAWILDFVGIALGVIVVASAIGVGFVTADSAGLFRLGEVLFNISTNLVKVTSSTSLRMRVWSIILADPMMR